MESNVEGDVDINDDTSLRVNTDEGMDPTYYTGTAIASRIRESFTTMTASSSLLALEAKWADEHVAAPQLLPLCLPISSAQNTPILGCVWQSIRFRPCAATQRQCVDKIIALRKATSTASSTPHTTTDIYGTDFDTLPLAAACPMTIEDDGVSQLTCVKKKNAPKVEQGAMATFYNPFAKKNSKGASVIKVAGEEERVLVYQFTNSLAIPVRVSQCRLEFQGDTGERVKSPTLAFEVPPKATSHKVRFPFTMIPPSTKNGEVEPDLLQVKGISLSCMNRSFFLPVIPSVSRVGGGGSTMPSKDMAAPASEYPHRSSPKVEKTATISDEDSYLKLQVFPCQPNPKLSFADTDAAVDPDSPITMGLTDGQVVATPQFRLSNYSGPSGGGRLQRLQISVVGIPGTSECILYDSNDDKAVASNESSDDEFLRELTEQENPPAMKARLLAVKSLNMEAINNSEESSPCHVAFQFAAGHNLGQKMSSETTITLRFKCAGQSTTSMDVWRIRQVPLRISYIKGPRIASLSLRPDLMGGSYFSEMCRVLASRDARKTSSENSINNEEKLATSTQDNLANQVGLEAGIHICSESILIILVVVNETNEDIVLSRSGGNPVGGLKGHVIDTLLLHNKVTSKIPMLIRRLPRAETLSSLVDAIVEKTTLVWETAQANQSTGHFARGRISIPSDKLRDLLVSKAVHVGPSLCEPPCQISFSVNGSASSSTEIIAVSPGQPMEVSLSAEIASWMSKETCAKCYFTVEFFCSFDDYQRADTGDKIATTNNCNHLWCGKVRHTVSGSTLINAENGLRFTHTAKIVLIRSGHFELSGCVRICQGNDFASGDAVQETWLAPVASRIQVIPSLAPRQ
jgi:hypothetical protein